MHTESMQLSSGECSASRELGPQKKNKPTELGKDGIAFVIQLADGAGDVSVSTADKNVGGDGSGQSHSAASEE